MREYIWKLISPYFYELARREVLEAVILQTNSFRGDAVYVATDETMWVIEARKVKSLQEVRGPGLVTGL